MDIKDMTIDEAFKYLEEKLRVDRVDDDVYRACKDHLPRVLEKILSEKAKRGAKPC